MHIGLLIDNIILVTISLVYFIIKLINNKNKKVYLFLLLALILTTFFLVPLKTSISYDKMKSENSIYIHTDRNESESLIYMINNWCELIHKMR